MVNYNIEVQELFEEFEDALEKKKQQAMKDFEQQLNETTDAIILEAVKHFSMRFRRHNKNDKTDVDERYFYNKNELTKFLELNKNPDVKIRTKYDPKFPNRVFCYIAYR